MISSYGDQSTTENNPSYYYRASPTLPQLLWMLPEHLMFYTCNYNIRVTHNGAIKHIFYTNQIHGGIISRLFFIHFVAHALALHLAVKILLQIFLCCRVSTLTLHTSVGYISLQNASRTALYSTQPILLSENIPNIWHKSSTKHKESDQIEAINDNANYAPSYHMEGFTNGSGCHF